MEVSEPLTKKQHLLIFFVYPTFDLQGNDKIIQNTFSPEKELLLKQNYILILTPAQKPHPQIAKTTIYHSLKQALFAITKKPCFVALIANANSLEPYKPQTYKEAVSKGNAK